MSSKKDKNIRTLRFNKVQQCRYSPYYLESLYKQFTNFYISNLEINQEILQLSRLFEEFDHYTELHTIVNRLQKDYFYFFENIIKQQKEIWEKLPNSIFLYQTQWAKLFEEIKSQYFFRNLSLKFHVNSDGTITIDKEIYSEKEFKENINKISKELINSTSLENFVEKFEKFLESPRKIVQFVAIVIFWIMAFLGNFVNVANYLGVTYSDLKALLSGKLFYSEIINVSEQDFKRKVKKVILKTNLNIPPYYRFVVVPILHVRNGPSKKAEIIDELPRGKIVQILRKKRRWCFIQYEDEDTGEIKSGWVFLRYLERF